MSHESPIMDIAQLRAIYDDTELAILFDWLELARPDPLQGLVLDYQDADAGEADEADEEDAEGLNGHIRLRHSVLGYSDDNALSNAVARLLLSQVQDRLPQWAAMRNDGHIDFARQYSPRREGTVELLPRFLFMINWADSGPGFSWPESYNVAYLPGFDRYVVTASQDSPDVHGYTDEAIGYFDADTPVQEGVHEAIVEWWRGQADNGQFRWAYLFQVGEIDSDMADAWAEEVWDADSCEPLG